MKRLEFMVVFDGVVSEAARLDRMTRINRILGIALSAVCTCLVVAFALFAVYSRYDVLLWLIPVFIAVSVVAIAVFFPDKKLRLTYPGYLTESVRVTICDGVIKNPYFRREKSVESVEKVIDAGQFYYLIFKFGDIGNSWVCQKDLLTQGTVEDFEGLFSDNLKRVKC